VLLAASLFFTQPTTVMAQYLLGRGRPRALALIQVPFGLVNLGATAILLVVVGRIWVAPLATLVLEGAVAVLALPLVLVRDGLAYRRLASAWGRAVAAGLAPACVTLVPAALLWHRSSSLPGVLAVTCAWAVALVPAAWFVGLGGTERSGIQRALRRLRPASGAPVTP
jgi:hypothetical protein